MTQTLSLSTHNKPDNDIQCILIDLDGTLYIDNTPILGAIDAIKQLRENGYTLRFLTNTTTKTRAQIADHLTTLGFSIKCQEIITAPEAARQFLLQKGLSTRIWPVVADSVISEFANFKTDIEQPEYIVVGDIGEKWNYELLNQIFNKMLQGAQLVALHKNRYWHTDNALHVDIGLFISGLEYVTGQSALLMGKPALGYYQAALSSVGHQPQEALVIGDDIESDVGGAQHAGITGVLVQTGKYRADIVANSKVTPEVTLASIANLPDWLRANGKQAQMVN